MNRKQFIVLLILVVVLGTIGWGLYQRNASSWRSASPTFGQKLLGDLPVNDVAALVIKSGTNDLTLEKKNNLWRVKERGDYPADYSKISGFLLKAMELKATQTEEVGPSQLGRYGLLPPGPATNTATLVEFRDQSGKTLKLLLIGKQHLRKPARPSPGSEGGEAAWPDGRYVMSGADAKTVDLISDPLGDAELKPTEWLNKDFFKVEKIRSIGAAFPDATNSWKASRETESGDWKLADAKPGEQLDSSKTSGFSYALSSPTFVDVFPTNSNGPMELEKPTVITLETFDGFTYLLKVGGKTNDDDYVTVSVAANLPRERTPGKDEKPEDKTRLDKDFKDMQSKLEEKLSQERSCEKWVYLVSNWTVDSLLKKRSELLAGKKDEPKKDEAKTEPSGGEASQGDK